MVRNDIEIRKFLHYQGLRKPSSVAFGATFPPGKVASRQNLIPYLL
jgi:hypothetical protein